MARKPKPPGDDTTGNVVHAQFGTNVPDETILRHVHACMAIKGRLETLQGEYRAALKLAKTDGVSSRAISWYLAARKRDPENIDMETRERNRIARLMALPIGTQLGFLDGQHSIADDIMEEAVDAQAQGRLAHSRGVSREANPHMPIDSKDYVDWDFGWFTEQSRVASAAAADLGGPRPSA